MIHASELIALFRRALIEEWGYIYGAAGETWTQAKQDAATREQTRKYGQKWVGHRVADCSGLFYWAFRQLGGYMYHGSNTMWKKYCTANGTLTGGQRSDGKSLKPGTAVFKYNTNDGYYHVGLFIGGNTVIEAKGTCYGVVSSKITDGWTHWGELTGVNYSDANASEGGTLMEQVSYRAKVTTQNGSLNVRKTVMTGAVIARLPKDTIVDVSQEKSGWLYVTSGTTSGWCDGRYLTKIDSDQAGETTEDEAKPASVSILITDSEGNTFTPIGGFTVKAVIA